MRFVVMTLIWGTMAAPGPAAGQPVVGTDVPIEPARAAGEARCGPEIVLIGDAWEHVQLEREALRTLVRQGDLVEVPERTAALLSHLAFMRNRSLMVFGGARERLTSTIQQITEEMPRWNALALADRRHELAAETPRLDAWIETLEAQYPEEALVSSSAASFLLPPVVPTLQITIDPAPRQTTEGEREVRFTLTGGDGKPVMPNGLHTTHGEKLHALLLDPAFGDYHHQHPQPTGTPGQYVFRFRPRLDGPYRLWLDAQPVATGRGEFPIADVDPIPRPIAKPPGPEAPILTTAVDEFVCRLSVEDGVLVFGQPSILKLEIREAEGRPVTRLQPLMGAFAHIVGFSDDFHTILHIHPLGKMPRTDERGGPGVEFQLRPSLPGWLRLYVQFSVDERVRLAVFVLPVVVQ